MATKDEKGRISAPKRQERIATHENERLRAYDPEVDEDAVPDVIETREDGTPGYIKYGAAVLLGLAFGVGCWVWYDGGVPSDPNYPENVLRAVPTEEYFAATGAFNRQGIPDPYVSPYEAPLEGVYGVDGYEITAGGRPVAAEVAYVAQAVPEAAAEVPQGVDFEAAVVPDETSGVIYYFDTDESVVPRSSALDELAEQARKTGATLDVEAYTDTHGRAAYNKRLSERRARAVGDYLIAHGVPANKVVCHGNGPTDDGVDDSHNRRAEVTIVE